MPSLTQQIDDTLSMRNGSITWYTHAYGWESTLMRMARDKNNYDLPARTRSAADRSIRKIERQLRDKKLMGMRERLIKATQAGDEFWVKRITEQMRAYNKEDLETGLY